MADDEDVDSIEFGREVLRLEAQAVAAQVELLDDRFSRAVDLVLGCAGHVVTTGMGKSGIVAQKISATLASTGTPSHYLHPSEAMHGDLGRIRANDIVLILSYGGETEDSRFVITPANTIQFWSDTMVPALLASHCIAGREMILTSGNAFIFSSNPFWISSV